MATLQDLLGSINNKPAFNPFGFGQSGARAGQSVSQSNTSYAYPNVASDVASNTAGNTSAAGSSLLGLLNDPANNSGVNAAYNSYLAAQRPSEEQGYQDLSDAFRNAGAMQDGSYGIALGKYASGIQQAHAAGFGDTLKSVLSPLVSGYSSLATQGPSLLDALKLSDSSSLSQSAGTGGGVGATAGKNPVYGYGPQGGGQTAQFGAF